MMFAVLSHGRKVPVHIYNYEAPSCLSPGSCIKILQIVRIDRALRMIVMF